MGVGVAIEEGACWDELWVLYVGDESLASTPEAVLRYVLTNLEVNEVEKNFLKSEKCLYVFLI